MKHNVNDIIYIRHSDGSRWPYKLLNRVSNDQAGAAWRGHAFWQVEACEGTPASHTKFVFESRIMASEEHAGKRLAE